MLDVEPQLEGNIMMLLAMEPDRVGGLKRRPRQAQHSVRLREMRNAVDRLLLTPEEAAKAIGVGRSKLYGLLRDGRIESVRIDGCRRVPRVALEEYVERLRTESVGYEVA